VRDERPRPLSPLSISAEARQFLDQSSPTDTSFPGLNDVDGWMDLISYRNQEMVDLLSEFEIPATTEILEIGATQTYIQLTEGASDTPDSPVYLDFHGGGLIYGGGESCRLMGAAVAMWTGIATWSVDYRMPPLHPYPAAIDDAMAAYRVLLERKASDRIVIGGSSAGGNVAAALLARARDESLPMPAALILMTPEVDLTESGDSFVTNSGIDCVLTSLMPVNMLYADGHDLTDPYVSPLFADVRGFPPTLLLAGTRDLFLSNAVRMHRKLRAAGVAADLHVFEAMPHGGFSGISPEDFEMRAEIRLFLDRHLHRS
jgi:monoterpene epsilon-lactone hydrolase